MGWRVRTFAITSVFLDSAHTWSLIKNSLWAIKPIFSVIFLALLDNMIKSFFAGWSSAVLTSPTFIALAITLFMAFFTLSMHAHAVGLPVDPAERVLDALNSFTKA